jgi:hypothetical protein
MNAIVRGRLPNACLVISDLAGAWGEGSLRIQQAIDNGNQEVGRGALDITPVRLDSIELYAILRTRLFERVERECRQDIAFRMSTVRNMKPSAIPTMRVVRSSLMWPMLAPLSPEAEVTETVLHILVNPGQAGRAAAASAASPSNPWTTGSRTSSGDGAHTNHGYHACHFLPRVSDAPVGSTPFRDSVLF